MFSLGGCPEIEAEVGFDMIEAYVFAFARHHLLDDMKRSHGSTGWEQVRGRRCRCRTGNLSFEFLDNQEMVGTVEVSVFVGFFKPGHDGVPFALFRHLSHLGTLGARFHDAPQDTLRCGVAWMVPRAEPGEEHVDQSWVGFFEKGYRLVCR